MLQSINNVKVSVKDIFLYLYSRGAKGEVGGGGGGGERGGIALPKSAYATVTESLIKALIKSVIKECSIRKYIVTSKQ